MKLKPLAIAALLACSAGAQAAPIYWNTWSSTIAGSLAAPSGTIAVTFAGPAFGVASPYPSWTPSATFADGSIIDNGPVAANGIMQLTGGTDHLNTVSFSVPVVDPVMAIWSLGQGGIDAKFVFAGLSPVFISGGPSAEYGGVGITVAGDTVSGREANGTIQFKGTYSSISWTNPVFENWYGFNVGIAEAAAVPEPESLPLLLAGLGLLGVAARRKAQEASEA
ncbi:MAG TPA: PEP-CTERM sorting domain-containing protein [Accumulibacter sp.]|uniref:PEP-CTERM sorting domain-containing protein n=1 Tax=Accumulibacter sp. TaxID=2053492 RepID=UPI0025CD4D67|nr:PEP-CTERM sorting domain-containing protein [Accumulibacter sp.]MCM8597404.1 PEP-CTERM sorting domain-containing protein [Accumulibacter sp.]MCM8662169.1 PEP-CTERM sorting domain-containing protein [Accumulibacter sp.]HNC52732.1 PEP-CTERM sorting domain-containing protein [Accumulibacter sp.]HNO14470.1 PEP-CTERM sorting domain-containing protein [Accumulibacter sp.]